MKKRVVYLIYAIVILVAASLVCLQRHIWGAENAKEVFHILADAFTLPAVLLIGISLLGLAASKGTYDMLRFVFGSVFSRFIPGMDHEKYVDFYEYRQALEEKKRGWSPVMFLCGLAALAAAILFLILYSVC